MVPTLLCLTFLLTILLLRIILKKPETRPRSRPTNKRLPPGSMGWPYIGETLQLYSQDPNIFLAAKQNKYGEIFKTHILGCPCIMLASPEAARFVLVAQPHLFKPTYPTSKERLIGPSALFFHQGAYHLRLRRLVQRSLSLDALRSLVPDVEAAALSVIASWPGGLVVNTFHDMKRFSFQVGVLAIFGRLEGRYVERLKQEYSIVDKGYNSFPTNIPGTPYRKALMARKKLNEILGEIISDRKEKKSIEKDLLGCLLNEKDQVLSDDQIADNIIGALFAAQDTTASALTWIVKYLHDNPKLLEAVKGEQEAVIEWNEDGKRPMSWRQTRNMPLTKGCFGEFEDGKHHIFHFQGSCSGCGVQGLPNSKRLEGYAIIQKHSSQSSILHTTSQV